MPQVVIVAGGRGTRLGPITERVPKILVSVGGKPFVEHVLSLLQRQGVESVHFCLGHMADQVLAYLRERPDDPVRYTASVEVEPLGTGGALRMAREQLDDEFVLLLGDTFTPVDIRDLVNRFRMGRHVAAMVVMENDSWLVPSNVRIDSGRVVEYAKEAPQGKFRHVDYGIGLLRRAVLDALPPAGPADLSQLYWSLIAVDALAAIEVPRTQRFYEIGSPTGYAEFSDIVRSGGAS